jgi:hypothetical protein
LTTALVSVIDQIAGMDDDQGFLFENETRRTVLYDDGHW